MATFDQLKQWIDNSDISKIGRTSTIEKEYKDYLVMVNDQWNSIDDYILFRVFNFAFESESTTGKRFVPRNNIDTTNINAVLLKNDFPYNVDANVQHYVLWSTQKLQIDQIPIIINKVLPKSKYDVVWFENPPALKSVKAVWHIQVFARPKPKDQCSLM